MAEGLEIPSDRQLVASARAGSAPAWSELRSRHERAVSAIASHRRPRGDVDETFERLHDDIMRGDDVIETDGCDVRPVRPRAFAAMSGGTYGPTLAPGTGGNAELVTLATAFGRLSEVRQTVLWHRLVDLEPAAAVTAILGRTASETVSLEATAQEGLFEAFIAVELESSITPMCRPVVALLGAYRRGTLPDAQRRVVDAHLRPSDHDSSDDPNGSPSDQGCDACRRRLAIADEFGAIVPAALVPGLTGLTVERYRGAIGAAIGLMGASALAAQRSARANRLARIGAAVAVVIALLGAAFLIRSPFDDLDGEIADLIENSTTSDPMTPTTTATTGSEQVTSTSDGGSDDPDASASRVELVFPGAPQGVVYVPGGAALDLGLSLSTPAPVYRNGTATIDAAITNNADTRETIEFVVRPSAGVTFQALTEGAGRCETNGVGATCVVDIAPGAVAPMSLRLGLDSTVSNRLRVVPSIRSQVLDLPIETVPGLVLATVARGALVTLGNTVGSCEPDVGECPASGQRGASSATLELPDGATIDSAVLLWHTNDSDSDGPGGLGLIVPGAATATAVVDADVTDLVRAAGAGRYTVVRPPSNAEQDDGSWTLIVITEESSAARRLLVVVEPSRSATADSAVSVVVPVGAPAPAGDPTSPVRATVLHVGGPGPGDDEVVSVDGTPITAVRDGQARHLDTYALDIDSSADALAVEVSTSTGPVFVAVLGLAVDIVT